MFSIFKQACFRNILVVYDILFRCLGNAVFRDCGLILVILFILLKKSLVLKDTERKKIENMTNVVRRDFWMRHKTRGHPKRLSADSEKADSSLRWVHMQSYMKCCAPAHI